MKLGQVRWSSVIEAVFEVSILDNTSGLLYENIDSTVSSLQSAVNMKCIEIYVGLFTMSYFEFQVDFYVVVNTYQKKKSQQVRLFGILL